MFQADNDDTAISAAEYFFKKALFFLFRERQVQVSANGRLYFILGHVRTLHYDFIAHHDRRGRRQVQFKILIRHVFRIGLGHGFNFNIILFIQHGDDLIEVFSRLTIRVINKESDL